MNTGSLARNAVDGAPDLLSLGRPLINIVSNLVDYPNSLEQLRLTCHLLKQCVDEAITTFTLGTAEEYNRIDDVQYEISRAALLWPGIKKITVLPFETLREEDIPKYISTAMRMFSETAWTDVEVFDCSRCKIYPSIGIALAACIHRWRKLRSLRLNETGISKAFIQNLASSDYPALEVLDLGNTFRDYAGDEVLDLGSNFREDAGVELTNLVKLCPNLKELVLGESGLGAGTLNGLFRLELSKLETIDLRSDFFYEDSDEEESINLGQARWPKLRKLILGSFSFMDSEWQSVAQGNWPFLEHLEITQADIGIDGAKALRDAACGPMPRWPRLTS